MLAHPRFIVIEGSEGAGKSSCVAALQAYFRQLGQPLYRTREPGGTPLAEDIRQLLLTPRDEAMSSMTELLLVFAARAQHVQQCIRPALQKGWVLCDRFTDSTYAYQGHGRGMSLEVIAQLERDSQDSLLPGLVILLDVPVDIGLERARQRAAADRIEAEPREFFERVRQGFLERAQQHAERYVTLDASQPIATVQQHLQQAITHYLQQHADALCANTQAFSHD